MKLIRLGFAIVLALSFSGCATYYYYGSPISGSEWSSPALAVPVAEQSSTRIGLSLEYPGTNYQEEFKGLKIGLDAVIGGAADEIEGLGWNLAFGATGFLGSIESYNGPARVLPGYVYSVDQRNLYSYGGTAQLSSLLLAGNPRWVMFGFGPALGVSFERGSYYEIRKEYDLQDIKQYPYLYDQYVYNTSETGVTASALMVLEVIFHLGSNDFLTIGTAPCILFSNLPYIPEELGIGKKVSLKNFISYQMDFVRIVVNCAIGGNSPESLLTLGGGVEFFLDGPATRLPEELKDQPAL